MLEQPISARQCVPVAPTACLPPDGSAARGALPPIKPRTARSEHTQKVTDLLDNPGLLLRSCAVTPGAAVLFAAPKVGFVITEENAVDVSTRPDGRRPVRPGWRVAASVLTAST